MSHRQLLRDCAHADAKIKCPQSCERYPYLSWTRTISSCVAKAVCARRRYSGWSASMKRATASTWHWTGSAESVETWGTVFHYLVDPGVAGVEMTVSDEHLGLVQALKRYFPHAMRRSLRLGSRRWEHRAWAVKRLSRGARERLTASRHARYCQHRGCRLL